MQSARVLVEVVAGVIPEQPEPEFTRQWGITTQQWEEAAGGEQSALLADYNGRAMGYAMLLMLQPDRVNWVRTDWIWL